MSDNPHFRAVFDTNVIIAALKSKNPNSPTMELLRRWYNGEFLLLYADELLFEYREKFASRHIGSLARVAFMAGLDVFGEHVTLSADKIPSVVADPDDDVFVACAVVGKATHLVTYDPHILSLGATYRGIAVLDGLHFLYAVRGDNKP